MISSASDYYDITLIILKLTTIDYENSKEFPLKNNQQSIKQVFFIKSLGVFP